MNIKIAHAAAVMEGQLYKLKEELDLLLEVASNPNRVSAEEETLEWMAEIREQMKQTLTSAEQFLRYTAVGPFENALQGQLLTEQEYLCLRALGVFPSHLKVNGLSAQDDYDAYRLLYYEDEAQRGLLDTDRMCQARRHPGGEEFAFTPVAPEEVQRDRLSPEQDAFLRQHFPAEYERFRPAASP